MLSRASALTDVVGHGRPEEDSLAAGSQTSATMDVEPVLPLEGSVPGHPDLPTSVSPSSSSPGAAVVRMHHAITPSWSRIYGPRVLISWFDADDH